MTRSGLIPSLSFGSIVCRFAFAQRFLGLQMDAVRAMHQAVQDRVGKRGIADVVMPVIDRELAGNDARTRADAIVDELEQVIAFARADRRDGEVVDDQYVDLGDGSEAFAEAAVGMAEAKLFEQTRCAYI